MYVRPSTLTFITALVVLVASCILTAYTTYRERFFAAPVVSEESAAAALDQRPPPMRSLRPKTTDKWLYDDAPNLMARSDSGFKLIYTGSTPICRDMCTSDQDCVAYSHNVNSKECLILSSISDLYINTSARTHTAFKHRPQLRDPAYMELPKMAFPQTDLGNIATVPNTPSLFHCAEMCDNSLKAGKAPCAGLEYDYKNETCRINSSVLGKIAPTPDDKIVALRIAPPPPS